MPTLRASIPSSLILCTLPLHGQTAVVDTPPAHADIPATHADPTTASDDDALWAVVLAPYVWVPAQNGTVSVAGQTAHVDEDIGETFELISENFNFGLELHLEISNDTISIFGDVMYIDLGSSLADGTASADVSMTQGISEFGGGYSLLNETLGTAPQSYARIGEGPGGRLEAIAGVRLYSFSTDIAGTDGVTPFAVNGSETWADAFIGLRGRYDLNEHFGLFLRGDVGGGGSDLVWNALAGLEIRFNDTFSLGAGYRAIDIDHSGEGGDFGYDMTLSGPFLAFVFTF
jgi:hypothetical protein